MGNSRRDLVVRLPAFGIRWSTVSGSGIALTIATGQVQQAGPTWALVVLGVVSQVCDVMVARTQLRHRSE